MKTNKNNGSALVAVIMVFAVLSILAVAVLGFMLSENKQSIYNQHKTQAYYIARSGAETVEAALISQLNTYLSDTDEQKAFLNVYDTPRLIEIDIDGVEEVIVKNETVGGNRILTVQSTSKYRGIQQTVKKAIYSDVIEINSGDRGITISNAPLMYIVSARQHTNKGITDIPPHIASKVESGLFPPHVFAAVTDAQWNTANEYVKNGAIIGGTVGVANTTTNLYVNGPLVLGGNITFRGRVNLYIKGNLDIRQNTVIISESEVKGDITEYYLNIYVYNEGNATYGLITPLKLHLTFKGNLYVKQGLIDIDMHQDAYIEGNIIYNGPRIDIGTQSSNIQNARKILQGSIYAPNSDVFIGFKNEKTAFILDGMIFGKNIHLNASNPTQANRFYAAITTSGIVNVPVNTGAHVITRTVNYKSIFID